jgi:hypothetical protein
MKRSVLLSVAGMVFLLLAGIVEAQCPEDWNDNGVCDTLYVQTYPPDQSQVSFPAQVRFPMRVTNDIPNPYIDSIVGMVFVHHYASSNPAANLRADAAYNNTNLYPFPDLENSVFRHLPTMQFPQERNWMMDLSEQGTGLEWDTRILDLGPFPDRFYFSIIQTGVSDQRFSGGNRVLTATITVTLDDTTTICIDTTWWVFDRSNVFCRSDAITYFPRDNMPYCASIVLSEYGDATGDGVINIADVMWMVNYLYKKGPYPASFEAGDANCDGDHSLVDIMTLINYLYRGGRSPGCI